MVLDLSSLESDTTGSVCLWPLEVKMVVMVVGLYRVGELSSFASVWMADAPVEPAPVSA